MTEAKYDLIAHWYDELVESDTFIGSIIDPTLWQLVGDVSGKHICDLGCGQGRLARELINRGAIVTGIDLSSELIEIAKQKISNATINYLVDNAETLHKISDSSFDMVISNLALMDMVDIDKVFTSIRRVLKSDSYFIFSITHPCFEAPHAEWVKNEDKISRCVHTYTHEGLWYSTNKQGVRGQVGAHHRMLSTYINSLAKAGFIIEQMIEPLMPQDNSKPSIGHQVIPAFIVIKCRSI